MNHNLVRSLGSILSWLYFWAILPFALFMTVVGEFIASPLENYRHHGLGMWVAWNLLRIVVPMVLLLVLMIGGIDLFFRIRHVWRAQ